MEKSRLDNIYEQLAEKHNLDKEQIKEIIKAQFRLLKAKLEGNDFRDVMLHYLGTFLVKQGRVRNKILLMYKRYRNNKITIEELRKKVTNLLKIRKKIYKKENG